MYPPDQAIEENFTTVDWIVLAMVLGIEPGTPQVSIADSPTFLEILTGLERGDQRLSVSASVSASVNVNVNVNEIATTSKDVAPTR
jgi:hypothetical protein